VCTPQHPSRPRTRTEQLSRALVWVFPASTRI